MRTLGLSIVFASSLLTCDAMAGLHLNRGVSPGKGCADMVTLKHPELKGQARKAEWNKCMANPGGYAG